MCDCRTNWAPMLMDLALLVAAVSTGMYAVLVLTVFTGGYTIRCERHRL